VDVVRGEQYLNRKIQYESVYDRGSSWAGREIVIRVSPNGLDVSRYGFAVGRRVGKAVVRNKVKRRLREILRQTPLQPGHDIVIIARASAAKADYSGLVKAVENLLFKAGLIVGEYEGVSPGTD